MVFNIFNIFNSVKYTPDFLLRNRFVSWCWPELKDIPLTNAGSSREGLAGRLSFEGKPVFRR